MALVSEIIDLARDIIRAESDSDVPVVGDSFMIRAISDANIKWAKAHQQTGNAPIVFQRETGFDLVSDTQLNGALATTDTTVTVDDSSSFPNNTGTGVIVVWDDNMPDFIAHTGGNGTTTFTGATGIAFAHEDNDRVQALYALPSDFGSFRKAVNYGDGVRLNGIPLYFTSGQPNAGYFSMYDDGTNKYLWLYRGASGSASVWYDKASATIDETTDTVDVPDEFRMYLVWYCVAFCYLGRADQADMYQFARSESDKVLYQALKDRNIGKKIRPRRFSRRERDYTAVGGQIFYL